MNRKMVSGIIVLIALVGIASVFLLIGQNTDTEPEKVYKPPSKEVMQKVSSDLAARKAQEAAKPQPPEEKTETGHRHADGTGHDEPHETTSTVSFSLPDFEGKTLQDRVAASDAVPSYAELKLKSQEELRDLMNASYAKAKSFDAEVAKHWEAWDQASVGSDEEKALKASLDSILEEQFVHSITGSRAFKVLQWRSIQYLSKNPLPNLIVMPIPEPMDP